MSVPAYAADKINVFIDRESIEMNNDPIIINGRTLIPIRSIFEALGAQIDWDGTYNKVTATKDSNKVELTIGSSTAYKNGQALAIGVPAQVINQRTFVPLRFITEALGYQVYWNGKANGIFISTTGSDPELAVQQQLSQLKTWKKSFRDLGEVRSVQQTRDGGYIVVGGTESFISGTPSSICLLKLDSNGNKQWIRKFGLPGTGNYAECVRQTDDNGFVIVGTINAIDSGIPCEYDIQVIKTDENGVFQWVQLLGKPSIGYDDSAYSVVQIADGGYIIAGDQTEDFSAKKGYLAKLNQNGAIQWERTLLQRLPLSILSIAQAQDGGYIIAGRIEIGQGENPLNTDADLFVAKIDKDCNIGWEKHIGGSRWDSAKSCQATSDGGCIVVGNTWSVGDERSGDAIAVKINQNGQIEWQRTFGGKGEDAFQSVIETGNGDFVFTGTIENFGSWTENRELYILKTDKAGNAIFEKSYGSKEFDWGSSISACYDGGYIIGGITNLDTVNNLYGEGFVVKTDRNGNI